jgi:hypothetical protein
MLRNYYEVCGNKQFFHRKAVYLQQTVIAVSQFTAIMCHISALGCFQELN